MKNVIVVLFLHLALSMNIYGQSTGEGEKQENAGDKASEQAERMRKALEGMRKDNNGGADAPILPDASALQILDDTSKEEFFTAMREYYRYRVSGYRHRARVFEWQLVSSRVIFVVVIFLVLAGVYFSWVQFRAGLSVKSVPEAASTEESAASVPLLKPDITEFTASVKGIKVSSPVLGVIILVISLVFFYLYLVYVYPIHEAL